MKRSTAELLLVVGAVLFLATRRAKLTRADLVKLARDTGFPDPEFAATIAMRESGGDPSAANDNPPRERSFGLWQINILAHPQFRQGELLDPKRNAEAAFEISKHGTDWTPWSTFKPGEALPPSTPAPELPDFDP